MASTRIRLDRIERGEILKELIAWYERQRNFARRFNRLRRQTKREASKAGIGPGVIDRLIREVRSQRASKT